MFTTVLIILGVLGSLALLAAAIAPLITARTSNEDLDKAGVQRPD